MSLFDPSDSRPIHFMGIAGAGMSALALVARRRGVEVSGCDIEFRDADDLKRSGAVLRAGHGPEHVAGARALVHTAAVPSNHEELETARSAGIPVLKRAAALGELVRGSTVVGIAGTHGKTTTTVMTTEALVAGGLDPTGLSGGRVNAWGGNARFGGDELFVVEADEYDRSFLSLDPSIAVVNNIEADHLECFGSLAGLEQAFAEFANRARRVLLGADDPGAMKLGSAVEAPVWTVGMRKGADFHVEDVTRTAAATTASIRLPEGDQCALTLAVPGLHNLRNAAMAVAVAYALGADLQAATRSLTSFGGVGRRFDVLGTKKGVTVVDDYAHHPSEVVATLGAARQRYPGARVIAVFQPHLFSRTKEQADAFGIALSTADRVVVTDVYAAREAPIPGVTGRLVGDAAERAGADVEWVSDRDDLAEALLAASSSGEVVIMLGAGDITDVAHDLIGRLEGAAA